MVRFFAVAGSSCSALRSLVVFLTMFGGQFTLSTKIPERKSKRKIKRKEN